MLVLSCESPLVESLLHLVACPLLLGKISQVMVCYEGHNQIAKLMGKSLITEDGEAIEGEALDDVTVSGVVTHIIVDVRSDSVAV
ncbi:hypothetical protein CWN37_09340 [Klebsiella pneumoniae]|nr:hypothetical protein CWN37_09340 [Klebsiella pneumoniae]